ncbi:MAG: hypothetical protein KatS3mg023_1648 [Armatimonadota bacterium]|nr:MAG: hypothetical protein KatS3mg023_1648 [Armatimonadota bacterium]
MLGVAHARGFTPKYELVFWGREPEGDTRFGLALCDEAQEQPRWERERASGHGRDRCAGADSSSEGVRFGPSISDSFLQRRRGILSDGRPGDDGGTACAVGTDGLGYRGIPSCCEAVLLGGIPSLSCSQLRHSYLCPIVKGGATFWPGWAVAEARSGGGAPPSRRSPKIPARRSRQHLVVRANAIVSVGASSDPETLAVLGPPHPHRVV